MNTALLVAQVLTCLAAVYFLPDVHGQATCCDNCCDDPCPAPTPFNVSLDEFVDQMPIFISVLPAIPTFAGVDNICFTAVPLPDGTYLLEISTVYCNGFNTSESLITNQDDVGVFSFGSGTCNAQITVFDLVNSTDCTVYLGYVCFNLGDCSLSLGDNIPVFGFSANNTAISESCLNQTIDRINRAGVDNQDYFIAPMKLNTGCITNINCTNGCADGS